jgi:hypothetical protein
MHVLYREGSRFTGAAASHASRKQLRDGSMPDGDETKSVEFFLTLGGHPGKQTNQKTIYSQNTFFH